MKLLLDSHVLLWALMDDPRLAPGLRLALDRAEALYLSAASIWEIEIKRALGRLRVDGDIAASARAGGCRPLPVTWAHAAAAAALPRHHADPFDRMLVAQAQAEGLTLASQDRAMAAYDVALLGA